MCNFLLIWSLASDVIAFYHQYKNFDRECLRIRVILFKISPHRKFYIGYTRYSNKDAMEPVHVEFKGQPRRGLIERRFTSFTALLLIFSLRLCYHFFFPSIKNTSTLQNWKTCKHHRKAYWQGNRHLSITSIVSDSLDRNLQHLGCPAIGKNISTLGQTFCPSKNH